MDSGGNIWWYCECGAEVAYNRDCPSCNAKSRTAETLSAQLGDAIRGESPDPFSVIRDRLTKEYQKRQRAKLRGR